MAKFSLRRFDVQARVSLIVSLASFVAWLAAVGLVLSADKGFENVDWQQFVITYGPARRLAVLGAIAVTLMLGVTGFGFGLSSAGQRRNDKPVLSWIGFFIGAAVICLTLILFLTFRQRGEPMLVP